MERRKFIHHSVLTGLSLTAAITADAAGEMMGEEETKGLRFLFQGDSITDGNRGRNTDPNHIMGHGYAFSIASRVGADFPTSGFTFFNRGISGNKIPDLQKRWQDDTLALEPDILSLLVGINDVNAVVDAAPGFQTVDEFEAGYKELLNSALQKKPGILLVLGLPFVANLGRTKNKWAAWKEGTEAREAVIRKLAIDFKAVIVDYPTVFDRASKKAPIEYWIWDGIHPTVPGHELMAREWIRSVSSRLKFLKRYKY